MRGQILIISIVFLAVILILCASLFSKVSYFLYFGSNSILREQATQLAEAGIDQTIWRLNETAGSCGSPYCGTEITPTSTGSFIVTIEDNIPFKTITSTGYIPNATKPRAKQTIKVDAYIGATTISFRYAVQVGDGGIEMANSSEISGTAYSNANIHGTGPSTIDGDAWAVGTVFSPPFVTGVPHSGAEIKYMPNIDYQYWKDAANINNDSINCGSNPSECNLSGVTRDIGPKKYIGNLEISGSSRITMNGPVWVTGNFIIRNLAELRLNESFGSIGTVLIVDGTVTVSNNGYLKPTSASPKGYILVVTTSSANPAVSISNMGASAVFYTLEGTARLANQAQVTALVAKSLNMLNSSKLIYNSGLAGAQFSAIGPGGSWQVKKGTYRFTNSP